jgi:magnesium-transporting ATPase (P-type)
MKKLMENLTLAVIVLVVSIPEGLTMTIDVSIGYSTIRMF